MIVNMSKVEIVGPRQLLGETLSLVRNEGDLHIEPSAVGFIDDIHKKEIHSLLPDEKALFEKIFLEELDEKALKKILTEPKNALVKQYQKLLSFDNVKLKFTEKAYGAIAREAIKRKTGARGLRAILEDVMLDIMYEVPSQNNIKECVITDDVVNKKEKPILTYEERAESA